MDTTEREVTITHPPTADLLLTPDSGCAPLDVQFANLSDAPYGTFTWDVNGNGFIGEAPPELNFTQGDSIVDYAVTLTATNLCGSDVVQATPSSSTPRPSWSSPLRRTQSVRRSR